MVNLISWVVFYVLQKCDVLIVGCGLSGSVIGRHLAEQGKKVTIWERRNHIGGNMYDYIDEHGILVQKYGPHAFHTNQKHLYEYVSHYADWQPYELTCGATWEGTYTPTPFNFITIDAFFPAEKARILKEKCGQAFPDRETATVLEVLKHSDADIRAYGEFLFQNDYAPYTAKQWGISPDKVDPSILGRVPLRFSYKTGYFDDAYQIMPKNGFTCFFKNLLNHPNIHVELNIDALKHLSISSTGNKLLLDGVECKLPVVYTGAIDELFQGVAGYLPYRSLRFEWKYKNIESKQKAPVVAYPQAEGYTRITEFKKLPIQMVQGTTYAIEYPLCYKPNAGIEPYYPVLTKESQDQYRDYQKLAAQISTLYCCGRLADFKYYNMDQALGHALEKAERIFSQ